VGDCSPPFDRLSYYERSILYLLDRHPLAETAQILGISRVSLWRRLNQMKTRLIRSV